MYRKKSSMKLSRREGSVDAVIFPSHCLVLVSGPTLSLGTLRKDIFPQTRGYLQSGCEGFVWKMKGCGEKET